MVVHDDGAVREALRFMLRLEGADVAVYEDGGVLSALEPRLSPDCLILRDRLPGLDGCELVRGLRQRGLTMPVILLTGAASPALRERAAAAGVGLVLEKPILGDTLAKAVASVLRCPPREAT